MGSFKKALEAATNVALLVVSVLFVWFCFVHRDSLFRNQAPTAAETALVGELLPHFDDYDWTGHPATLVLALREGCQFCAASMPFYRHLAELQHAGKLRANLLTVMPDLESSSHANLRSQGVDVDGTFGRQLAALNVSGTPTLMLVNREGRVTRAWVGQLQPQQERAVIEAVSR